MVMKPKQETKEEETKQMPIANYRAGTISVSIFEKTLKNEKGDFKVHSANVQKSYKDKKGEWQHMSLNLNKHDLAKARIVIQKAEEFLLMTSETTTEDE